MGAFHPAWFLVYTLSRTSAAICTVRRKKHSENNLCYTVGFDQALISKSISLFLGRNET